MDRDRYRVFDKKENRYYKSSYSGGDFLLGEDGTLYVRYPKWGFSEVCYPENYIVEFCTGLKDKNGKLIYEGDIVKFANDKYSDVRKGTGFIEYKHCEFGINTDNESNWWLGSRYLKAIEIIGTIHDEEGE